MKNTKKNQGSNKLPIFVGLGAIALVMMFTNPGKDKFLQYSSAKMLSSGGQNSTCTPKSNQSGKSDPIKQALEQATLDMCKQMQQGMGQMMGDLTTRQNFIFFSIYTTELGGYTSSALGIFGNFISLG